MDDLFFSFCGFYNIDFLIVSKFGLNISLDDMDVHYKVLFDYLSQ